MGRSARFFLFLFSLFPSLTTKHSSPTSEKSRSFLRFTTQPHQPLYYFSHSTSQQNLSTKPHLTLTESKPLLSLSSFRLSPRFAPSWNQHHGGASFSHCGHHRHPPFLVLACAGSFPRAGPVARRSPRHANNTCRRASLLGKSPPGQPLDPGRVRLDTVLTAPIATAAATATDVPVCGRRHAAGTSDGATVPRAGAAAPRAGGPPVPRAFALGNRRPRALDQPSVPAAHESLLPPLPSSGRPLASCHSSTAAAWGSDALLEAQVRASASCRGCPAAVSARACFGSGLAPPRLLPTAGTGITAAGFAPITVCGA